MKRDVQDQRLWSDLSEEARRSTLRTGVVTFDYPDLVASDWPDLLDIVEKRVKPERLAQKRERRARLWWQFAETAPGLTRASRNLESIVGRSMVSNQWAFARIPAQQVNALTIVSFVYETLAPFAALQSRIHEVWARFFASSMKDDLRYTPSDCFETFPFPPGYETDPVLEAAGQAYHDHRAALMVEANEGMTKTYNRFHKPEEHGPAIARLRELHDAMDRAVLRAYGWDDLAVTLRPVFLTPETEDDHTYQTRYFWPAEARDLVLSRLLALNAERHAEEVAAGIAPARTKRASSDNAEVGDHAELFDDG